MTELNVRVGDVVRLKPQTLNKVDHRDQMFEYGDAQWGSFSDIESIISRAETPQEEIARLKAENAKWQSLAEEFRTKVEEAPRKIEWSGGECPVDSQARVVAWMSSGRINACKAGEVRWDHHHDWVNIIAYMVIDD
jgi:hypothetical protein